MNEFQKTHSPWCRIHHNPGSTTECWCVSDMAATAYKLGRAEGNAAIAEARREANVVEARAAVMAEDARKDAALWRGRPRQPWRKILSTD